MKNLSFAVSAALVTLMSSHQCLAAPDADIHALRQEFQAMKKAYENRISDLEANLKKLKPVKVGTVQPRAKPENGSAQKIPGKGFNPSIGVILNGKYTSFSEGDSKIAGFGIGEEGERGREGLGIDESELNFSANVDDKFHGSLTAAIVREGGADIIELEEAYIKTLPGSGMPDGLSLKAGRALWTFGYLNEHHAHADDFADRPLPYRTFLNNAFNDDGVEVSYVLPTEMYAEIGGGVFRGDDFPFGNADGEGISAWSTFARIGGDLSDNQSWRIGGYILSGEAKGGRNTNEDSITFTGDSDLYAADLRYTWAPTGNPHAQEVTLQGEYFWRDENGFYEDTGVGTGAVAFKDNASGWYVQSVYKFHPQWRVGARYSRLESADVPAGLVGSALDSEGHNPQAFTVMGDWTNSEFSRVRLQFSHEDTSKGLGDEQATVQYIMSLGAHGAHSY